MKSRVNLAVALCGVLSLSGLAGSAVAQSIPTSYSWTSTGPIISPKSDSTHNIIAVKDPSAVLFNGRWVIYASDVNSAGNYNMEYLNVAADWSDAATAKPYFMDNTPGFSGYHTAPQVFFFAPQKKWYLIFQSGQPQFSTNADPTKPQNWTQPKNFYASQPSSVSNWIDFWVICDTANCYLFFNGDNGNFYRASTPIGNFPNGFNTPVIVDSSTQFNMFEADNVYTIEGGGGYVANIECLGPNGQRYFRTLWASNLGGTWSSLGDTDNFSHPFLGQNNVTFASGVSAWTTSFSSGGLLINGNDQTDSVNLDNLQFLYQGANPAAYAAGPYNFIPWQLALATSKANTAGFTLSDTASSLTVKQGATATDTLTVVPANGVTGAVSFSATGLPSGVTASFSPTSSTSSLLTVTASSTAATGTFPITITGTSGSTKASTKITLSVGAGGGKGSACAVAYTISPQSSSTFGATLSIINNGSTALSGWSLSWSFANGQTIAGSWDGAVSQSGGQVTVSEQAGQTWENIPAGGSYSGFGFNGTWNGTTNAVPTNFSLNGTACTVN
jgi:glycosyl hydrolase family 62/cellulose binding protein with CBM2 domain